MSEQRFKARLVRLDTKAYFVVPFDPNEVWGYKERHYVTGSINDERLRALLDQVGSEWRIPRGAAWLRDTDFDLDATFDVVLQPEGPQLDSLAPDFADALAAEPEAVAFFESLATFYRKNLVRWIDDAKRPETRAKRIAEAVQDLKAGRRRS